MLLCFPLCFVLPVVPGPGLGREDRMCDGNKVLGMGFEGESSRSFTLRRSQDWLERSGKQGGGRSEKVSTRGGYG